MEDAYGRNIHETYLEQGGGYDIVEREDGCFTLNGDSNAYTEPFEDWSAIQKEASLLLKGKGLDVGCGGGKHSLELQARGCDILGMDNSPLALEVCRLRGLKKTLLCDVANLPQAGLAGLDFILLWGNNTGLLQNGRLAKRFLNWAYMATKSDAAIYLETLDPHGKAFDFVDDREYINENIRIGRLPGQIRVRVRYRKYCTPWADYLFLSKKELNDIVEGTGWRVERYWDDEEVDQYIARLVK